MATLSRSWILVCLFRTGTRSVSFLGVLAGLIWTMEPVAIGSPVTFRFEATVTNVVSGNPFDLPFTIEIGDVISGSLTFDPETSMVIADNAVKADQSLGLGFVVDGTTFGSSTYGIEVINDTPIIDEELTGPIDMMTIHCSPSAPQPCTPALHSFPGGDPFSIGARLTLMGDESIYDAAEISSDPVVWNSFVLDRSLSISFRNQDIGSTSVFATIGTFAIAPEPATFHLVIILALCSWTRLGPKRVRKGKRV